MVHDYAEILGEDAWWVGYIKEVWPIANTYAVRYSNKVPTKIIATENIQPSEKYDHMTIINLKKLI